MSVPASFSAELRSRTSGAHAAAERSPYLIALASGRVSREGLAALVGRLLPVYEALEAAAASWADDPVVGRFVLPALHRAGRLRADLRCLTGAVAAPVSAAATAYAARVTQVAATSAPGFVAHHYTRYLGDLSGGQVLRAALERGPGVGEGTGASHLHFPGLRPAAVRQGYRSALDEAPFTAAEREELVREALRAYGLNVGLARELDEELPRWTGG